MSKLERIINGQEKKWLWFCMTLIGSFIPVITRVIISSNTSLSLIDIKDVLFGGLAMNLANLNFGKYKSKDFGNVMTALSVIAIFCLGIFIANVYTKEADNQECTNIFWFLAWMFTIGSIYLNWSINLHFIKTKKQ
ncbi:hypothetical protein [Ferruginibacter sp. HRS2-29]|uniref:hypothetical protein n=1 Tax=Ferruginibacter sp. HRS2-29 TaxID=2487334 RepID=UPI0020CECD54|nr:hypothetical protein [Ferruginibacter sp. HRS2-29]MCP9752841.1 hypothetical protein [Ferruginibacter sp. HRS2-29]